jgi:hypothetical protein
LHKHERLGQDEQHFGVIGQDLELLQSIQGFLQVASGPNSGLGGYEAFGILGDVNGHANSSKMFASHGRTKP